MPRHRWALVVCLILSACAGLDQSLNPFYLGWADEDSGRSDSLVAGPLFDDARTEEGRETALHPLWRSLRTPEKHEVQVLDPLFQWRSYAERSEFRFLALAWYRRFHLEPEPEEWDLQVFPLLWAGGGAPDEDYFALFPLGGTIRAFAGFEKVFFLLFPLYYRLDKNITTPESFHNITPLIGWADGGPRDGSWRILPFYGHWRWEGKFERSSFLWPIFHYQRNRLDQPDPATLFTFWPLFSREVSDRHRFWAFLWPFFRFREESVPARAEYPAQEYYRYDVLWPLYRRERNRDFERLRLFPFFSRYRSEEIDSDAFAIPFLWRREERRPDWRRNTFHLIPVVYVERKQFHDGRPDDRQVRVWPLVSWSRRGGDTEVVVPPLLPMGDNQFTRDFRANWEPWVRLYHDRRGADGSRRLHLLFRLLEYRHEGDRTRWSVPLLYSGESRSGQVGLVHEGAGPTRSDRGDRPRARQPARWRASPGDRDTRSRGTGPPTARSRRG